jgi:hypothetical protein
LVEAQALFSGQLLLGGFGVVAIDLCESLEDVADLVFEVDDDINEVASTVNVIPSST